MGSFGESLRREREMRGVTLEEISDNTKISVRFLDALETEQFSKLPGGIFTRSFIRSYANYLGLDPEQVLAEYQSVFPPKNEEDFSRIGVNHAVGSSHAGGRTLLAWIIAAILLAGGYALFRYSHQRTDATASFGNLPQAAKAAPFTPTPETAAANSQANATTSPGIQSSAADGAMDTENSSHPPPSSTVASNEASPSNGISRGESSPSASGLAPRNTPPGSETAAGNIRPAGTQTPSEPAGTVAEPTKILGEGNMVLQIAATERSWVAVECDGKTLLQRILNPNEVRTLRASNSINVTTGNAQGITLTLNGQALKPLGRYGEVKTIRLTLADLKKPTPNP